MSRLWDTEALADFLGKSPQWVRENIKTLEIPAYKLGNHWRFHENAIMSWLEQTK
jgi:excisionase family DNA binding protein